MGRPATSRRGTAGREGSAATSFELESLTFASDHGLLTGCDDAPDWTRGGSACPVPQWRPDEGGPVSHSMGEKIRLAATVRVPPGVAAIRGRGPDGMLFEWNPPRSGGELVSAEMVSNRALERKIRKLSFDVDWSGAGRARDRAIRTSNVVYVTWARPIINMQRVWQEDGVTLRRMDTAVSWIAPLDTLDPHAIVAGLMQRFPGYTLRPSPKVPKEYDHPRYFNQKGGAWPLAEFAEESAECQAIARLMRGMLRQLGVPGTLSIIVVWADPRQGGGREALTADWEQTPSAGLNATGTVNGRRAVAALVDSPVEEGKTYPPSHTRLARGRVSPGLNRYEACLKLTHNGKTLYYAAGAGIFENKEDVLRSFWGLVWVSQAKNDGYRVERIVARYRTTEGAP